MGKRRKGEATPEQVEREQKIARCVELYLEDRPMRDIAKEVGIDVSTVSRYIKKAREHWAARNGWAMAKKLDRLLAQLSKVRREAWKEFHRSKAPKETTRREAQIELKPDPANPGRQIQAVTGERTVRITEQRTADARFLSEVRSSLEMEAKIIGAFAPIKVAPTTPDGSEQYTGIVEGMTDEQLEALDRARQVWTSIASGRAAASEN